MGTLLGKTHFVAEGKMARIFKPTTCESCGGETQEANTVSVSIEDAKRFKLIEVEELPPEEFWSD